MYIAPIAKIAVASGVCIHQYADDTQLYIKFTANEGGSKTLVVLENCTDAISDWMLHNGLALNPPKSEVIEFGKAQALHKSNIQDFNVAGNVIAVSDQIKSLGVVLDKRLSFNAQVNRTCKTIPYHARSFRHIRNSLLDILARTVASWIISRLEYCNSLLVGTAQTNVIKLQRAQNSIACIVTGTSRFDHIQPVLKELHWLPVDCRIKFEVAMLVYKIRQTDRPAHLSDFIHERAAERASRSSNMHHMELPRRKLETGKRAFSYAAPTIWNNLPQKICQTDLASVSLSSFKKQLKTHFFSIAYS